MKRLTTATMLTATIALLPTLALAQSDDTWFFPDPETAQCVPMSEEFNGIASTPFQLIAALREGGGIVTNITIRHPSPGVRVVIVTGQVSDTARSEAWSFANDADECRVVLRIEEKAGVVADPSQTN